MIDRLAERRVVHRVDLIADERAEHIEAEVVAHLGGDLRAVAGDDLHENSELGEPGERGRGVGLRAIGEHQEADQAEVLLLGIPRHGHPGRGPRTDRDDARAGVVEVGERLRGRRGHTVAAREHAFGLALHDQPPLAVGGVGDHDREPALVVERAQRHALPTTGLGGDRRVGRVPQRDIEGVAAHRLPRVENRLVADQPEQVRPRYCGAGRIDRAFEGDVPFGERARLVGEEQGDVAEILDAHQALHEHLLAREPAGAGRQAHGDDRGKELGREPDRDRQREQQRVDERPMENDVDHEDRHGENAGHPHEQERELPQPDLERSLARSLAQTGRDPPEGRLHAGAHDHAPRGSFAHDRSHQCARLLVRDRIGRLVDRHRLAGQHGLVALELGRLEQPNVGGNDVADRELHDVARHE